MMQIVSEDYSKLGPIICFSNYSILFGYNNLDTIHSRYKELGFKLFGVTDINLMSAFQQLKYIKSNLLKIYGVAINIQYEELYQGLAYIIFYTQAGYYEFLKIYNKKIIEIVNSSKEEIIFTLEDFRYLEENCGFYILIGANRSLPYQYMIAQQKVINDEKIILKKVSRLIKNIEDCLHSNLYWIVNDISIDEINLMDFIQKIIKDKNRIIYNYPVVHLETKYHEEYLLSPHVNMLAIAGHKKATDIIIEDNIYFSNAYYIKPQVEFIAKCIELNLLTSTNNFFDLLFGHNFDLSLSEHTRSYSVINARQKVIEYSCRNLISFFLSQEIGKLDNKSRDEFCTLYYRQFLLEIKTYDQITNTDVYSMLYVVHMFVTWSKNNDISIGPGRGSCVGSLIIYLLDITSVNPIHHSLLFERFLNLERLSMPDIDIDVCKDRRSSLIKYVGHIFQDDEGNKNIVQIIVFLKFIFKMMIKDLLRISNSNIKFIEINRILKIYDDDEKLSTYLNYMYNLHTVLIKLSAPDINLSSVAEKKLKAQFIRSIISRMYQKINGVLLIRQTNTLSEIMKMQDPEEMLRSIKFIYDKFQELFKVLPNINSYSSCIKTTGIHAAGMLIGNKNFLQKIPLYFGSNADQEKLLCTQYDMDMLSKMNAIKFDILGLDNLSVITEFCNTVGLIYDENLIFDIMQNSNLQITQNVYLMLKNGAVKNVFQLEKFHIGRLCKKIFLSNFEDTVALNALNRPGTSGVTQQYVDNKKLHAKNELKNLIYKPIYDATIETYGVMIYQEQIMQAVKNLANYSTAEADIFRAIISKKKKELLEAEKAKFIQRCALNNVSLEKTIEVFEIIEKFAGYAFNKSHAVAYSKITVLTAYLKYVNYVIYNLVGFIHKMDKTNNLQNMIEIMTEMIIHLNMWTSVSNIRDITNISYIASDNQSYSFKDVCKLEMIRIKIPAYIVKGISENDISEIRSLYHPNIDIFDVLLKCKITKSKLTLLNSTRFFIDKIDTDKLFQKLDSIKNLGHKFKNNLYNLIQNDKIKDFKIQDPDIKAYDLEEIEKIGFSITRLNIALIIKKIIVKLPVVDSWYYNNKKFYKKSYDKDNADMILKYIFIVYKSFDAEYNIINLYNVLNQKIILSYKTGLQIFDIIFYMDDKTMFNLTRLILEYDNLNCIMQTLKINFIGWVIKFKTRIKIIINKNLNLRYIYKLFQLDLITDVYPIFNNYDIIPYFKYH